MENVSVEILEYRNEHQPWFEKFNREWIEKYFWMEPIDVAVLQHPDEHIIQKGGTILMISVNGEIAGTVALKFTQSGVFEFTKMAVDEKFRGKKIGQKLAEAGIKKAVELGAEKIILYSHTSLRPAIALYRKLGFAEVPVDGPYKRSDIKMELIPAKREGIRIRKATLQDATVLCELGARTFSDTFAAANTEENMKMHLAKYFNIQRTTEELQDVRNIFLLACEGSQPAGYAKIRATNDQPEGVNANAPLEIERIYVDRKYQGRGVGKILMEACLAHAQDNAHDVVWLGVWEHNPRAINFYHQWGFERFGQHTFMLGTDAQTDLLYKRKAK